MIRDESVTRANGLAGDRRAPPPADVKKNQTERETSLTGRGDGHIYGLPRAAQPPPIVWQAGARAVVSSGAVSVDDIRFGRKPGDRGLFDIVDHGRDAQAAVRETRTLHLRIKLTLRLCKVLGMAGRKSGFNLRV